MGSLEGKVALVTGAARGQGRAFARRLAAEGADIAAFDICGHAAEVGYALATPADLDTTVAEVKATGQRILAHQGDVRDQAALDALVSATLEDFDRIDVVVACAGISAWGRFWELTEEQWQSMIDINLSGVWRTFKAAVPAMIEAGEGGSIVAISSVAGLKALPGQAHYSAAKHGIVGLVNTAAKELGPHNIRVNSIHPWGVETAMTQDTAHAAQIEANPHYLASYGSALTNMGIAAPDDIANAVVFLASDASKFITGTQLRVDMGAVIT
jgi:SDR family mycofactocin-dependent oxidoreductase